MSIPCKGHSKSMSLIKWYFLIPPSPMLLFVVFYPVFFSVSYPVKVKWLSGFFVYIWWLIQTMLWPKRQKSSKIALLPTSILTHTYIYMLTTYTGKKEENPRSDMVFNQTFQNSHLLIFFILITRMIRTFWACFLYSSLQYYPNQVRYER